MPKPSNVAVSKSARTLLRRLERYKRLREQAAPPVLVAVEGALIGRSISTLTVEDLLQVLEAWSAEEGQ